MKLRNILSLAVVLALIALAVLNSQFVPSQPDDPTIVAGLGDGGTVNGPENMP